MSCISYQEMIDPRRYFQEYTVASGTFTTEFELRNVVALFKSRKPAARRLELRIPKFLCYFRCKLMDERTIHWNALFGFFLSHSHAASFTSEYCEVRLRFFALENPLSYSSLSRVFCFRMLLTCVFPQPNLSASLRTPVNPLLFSYSSAI